MNSKGCFRFMSESNSVKIWNHCSNHMHAFGLHCLKYASYPLPTTLEKKQSWTTKRGENKWSSPHLTQSYWIACLADRPWLRPLGYLRAVCLCGTSLALARQRPVSSRRRSEGPETVQDSPI